MAEKIKMEIIGDEELKRKLQRLGQRAQAALVKANQAAGEPVINTANTKAPGPHVVQSKVKLDGGRAESDIGPDKDHWHYQFAETGATAHEIGAGKKARRALRIAGGGRASQSALQEATANSILAFVGRYGLVVTKKVNHPGHSAEPFLRPAANQEKDAARDAAGRVFWREIEKECDG